MVQTTMEESKKDAVVGIESYERNLRRLGIEDNGDDIVEPAAEYVMTVATQRYTTAYGRLHQILSNI